MMGRMNEAKSSEQITPMAMLPEVHHPTPGPSSDVGLDGDGEVPVPPPPSKPDVRDPPPDGPRG
ncbi:hypothetical protein SAMN05443572_106296 [Myxococcus fulvus]|uniref:Uncharacterized protein n=1 Tax=Myxococcus fulvus TaxID=33 RepID=A0A511T4M3_MYXFU|nr:hypothetical protein [Myxococcus fulvus]GEN08278.1 hypothetical protein MFU01_33150 [Myxococcus fulvus]SEU21583.1 hypothetical protein SAMN05443572_106296 [Myxococcus fulvus]